MAAPHFGVAEIGGVVGRVRDLGWDVQFCSLCSRGFDA